MGPGIEPVSATFPLSATAHFPPHSRPANALSDLQSAEAGFTLIEMLVATAIMAILALGAALALPRAASPEQRDMARFQQQFEALQTLAITGGQSRGLRITRQGLQLALRQDGGWQFSPKIQPWQGRVGFAADGAQQPASSEVPEIRFLATGEVTGFDIAFGSTRRCQSAGWAGLICSGP